MTQTFIWTVAILTVLGLLLALILFWVARKFKVEEDPRIDEVEKVMPGANCGGCGFAGCRAFADAAVKAPNLDNQYCPVGGDEVMQKVASILGFTVAAKAPQVAVVRCNGTCEARPRTKPAIVKSSPAGDSVRELFCLFQCRELFKRDHFTRAFIKSTFSWIFSYMESSNCSGAISPSKL